MLRALLATLVSASFIWGVDSDSSIFPKLSPHASVSQTLGTTTISIDFHRPAVRGRKIWGDLVPYGQVWRTGANEATTIRFSDAVKVNGSPVPAGSYALFAIPSPDGWTLILNKRWKQFGAFEYQPKDDLLRFDVKPKAMPNHTEWLEYEINPASRSSAYVDLFWEKLRVSFLVEVEVDSIVSARLKRAIAHADPDDWRIYADAAQYYWEQNTQLALALSWVDKSIRIQENPTNLFVKARLLRDLNQSQQAQALLEKALKLARSQNAPGSVTGPIIQTMDQWKHIQGLNHSQGK